MKLLKNAFTMVELVVVVAILGILSTLGFLSFSGYTKDAKIVTKVTDIKNIGISFEAIKSEGKNLPEPDNGTAITYSGNTLWTQGLFGNEVVKAIPSIFEVFEDKELKAQYTYSLDSDKQTYQLGAIIGGDLPDTTSSIFNTTYANSGYKTYLDGNYGCGELMRTEVGGVYRYLGIPSMIVGNTDKTDILEVVQEQKLALAGSSLLPRSYGIDGDSSEETFVYGGSGAFLEVYAGDIADINSSGALDEFATKLNEVFKGTTLEDYNCYQNPSLVIDQNFGILAIFTPDPEPTETITPETTEFNWEWSGDGDIKCRPKTVDKLHCDFSTIDLTLGNGQGNINKYWFQVNGKNCGGKRDGGSGSGELNVNDCYSHFNDAGTSNEIRMRIPRLGGGFTTTTDKVDMTLPSYVMATLMLTVNGDGVDFQINSEALQKNFRFYVNNTACDTNFPSGTTSGRIDSTLQPACGYHLDSEGKKYIKVRYNADDGEFWSDEVEINMADDGSSTGGSNGNGNSGGNPDPKFKDKKKKK